MKGQRLTARQRGSAGFLLLALVLTGLLWGAWLSEASAEDPAAAGSKAGGGAGACALCHDPMVRNWPATTHGKAGITCTACHPVKGLHASALTPANAPERCGRCHFKDASGGQDPLAGWLLDRNSWAGKGHGKAGLSCLECHSVHRPSLGSVSLMLKDSGNELCLRCHSQVPQHQAAQVDERSLMVQNCTICHDPHGGQGGLLMQNVGGRSWDFNKQYKHFPVAQGKCNQCHSPHLVTFGGGRGDEEGEAREGGLLITSSRKLCAQCHPSKNESLNRSPHAKIQGLGREEDPSPCLACHLPHTSDYQALTKLEANRLCLACHAGYTPHHFLSLGRVRQNQLACTACHDPHGSGKRRMLVADDGLCNRCHKK
ncbi:MAG: cytochrome c3 family protein [Bacillota bacterium]|nr:cytochrome c3 family protein [Bacillota bacterium]